MKVKRKVKKAASAVFASRFLLYFAAAVIFALPVMLAGCGTTDKPRKDSDGKSETAGTNGEAEAERPSKWAQPLEKPGLPNLHVITPGLYRGAQPTKEGMKQLKEMGVKTIINLRSMHSDKDEMEGLEFNYEHINFKTWHAEDEDVVRFLKLVTDESNAPVFFHCMHGADRTGMMCAMYRIFVDGWTKEEAIREMTEGGFGHHSVFKNLVKYINGLDVDKIKKMLKE